MKRRALFNVCSAVSAALVFVLVMTTCKPGLGTKVDILPPTITITYPPAKSIIRDTFVMKGGVADDGSIKSVVVSLAGTKGTLHSYGPFSANIDKAAKTWEIHLNKPVTPEFVGGPSFDLLDGAYEFIVKAEDAAGRVSSSTTVYEIDNTPPLVVLNRPSTVLPGNSDFADPDKIFDRFGTMIKAVGQVSDAHLIDKLRFTVYTKDSSGLITEAGVIEKRNIAPQMNVLLGVFGEAEGLYKTVYGTTKKGTQKNFFTIELFDNARAYKNDGHEETSQGNSSNCYYLYEKIYDDVLQKKTILDVHNIFNGSYSGDATVKREILQFLNNNRILSSSTSSSSGLPSAASVQAGVFSINPENSPSFSIAGKSPITPSGYFTLVANSVSASSTIALRVKPGLDDVPLKDVGAMRVFIREVNDSGDWLDIPADETAFYSDGKSIQLNILKQEPAGLEYTFTVEVSSTNLRIGRNYRVMLQGEDKNGNNFYYQPEKYGFKLASSGTPPELDITKINGDTVSLTTGVIFDGGSISLEGNAKASPGGTLQSIKLFQTIASVDEEIKSISLPTGAAGGLWTCVLNSSDLRGNPVDLQGKNISILVKAQDNNGNAERRITLYYDKEAPKLVIDSVQPSITANGRDNNVNGTVSVKGTISDDDRLMSGTFTLWTVKSDGTADTNVTETYRTAYNAALNPDLPVDFNMLANPARFNFTIKTQYLSDEKEYIIRISGKDRAGREAFVDEKMYVSQITDKPVIILDSSAMIGAKYLQSSKGQIGADISDDDGIGPITVKVSKGGTSVSAVGALTKPTEGTKTGRLIQKLTDLSDGEYEFIVTVEDKDPVDPVLTTTKTFLVIIDSSDPQLEEYDNAGTRYISAASASLTTKLTYRGKVTDGWALAAEPLSVSIDGGVPTAITPASDGEWTYVFDASGRIDKEYRLTFKALDAAGKTAELTRSVIVDSTPPVLNDVIQNSAPYTHNGTNYYTGSVKIEGNAADAASGIEKVQYSLDGSVWIDFSGTTIWQGTIPFTDEKTYTVDVRAIDKAKNVSAPMQKIIHTDLTDPIAGINALASAETKTDTLFAGNAHDNGKAHSVLRQADSAVLSYAKDGGTPLIVAAGTAVDQFNWNKAAGTWSWTLGTALGDGLYTVTLKVTDAAGRVSEASRTVKLDTTAPELTVTSPAEGQIFDMPLCQFSGTVNDVNGVGVSSVSYSLDAATWTSATLNGIYWKAVNVALGAKGKKTFYVRTQDKLGNTAVLPPINCYYDAESPVLIANGLESEKLYINNASAVGFVFTGTMTDDWMFATSNALTLSVNSGSPVSIPLTPAVPSAVPDSRTWTYTYNNSVEGEYRLDWKAADAAGRTTLIKRIVVVDKSLPVISGAEITTPKVTLAGKDWYKASILSLRFKADDARSGVANVEIKTNSGLWTAIAKSGEYYTGTVSVIDGENEVTARVTDLAGNANEQIILRPMVDTTIPSLAALVYKVDGTLGLMDKVTNATAPVEVSFAGISDAHSGLDSVQLIKIGSTDISGAAPVAFTGGTAIVTILPAQLQAGTSGGVIFRVSDKVGNYVDVSLFTMTIDKTPPSSIMFTSPSNGATVNKTITLNGTASDNQGLSEVSIEKKTGSTWAPIALASGTSVWNCSINTADYDDADGNGELILRAVAKDTAGNIGYSTDHTLTINQHSDRPVIKFNNLSLAGMTSTKAVWLKTSREIYGGITDDDGAVKELYISTDGGLTWGSPVTISGGSFSFGFANDGPKKLSFKLLDAAGGVFISQALGSTPAPEDWLASPVLTDGTHTFGASSSVDKGSSLNMAVDTYPPAIGTVHIDTTPASTLAPGNFNDAAPELLQPNMDLGGGKKTFALKITANDDNGIDTVKVKAGVEYIAVLNGADGSFVSPTIDTATMADGLVDIEISVTDASGLTTSTSRRIRIDNAAPVVKVEAPEKGAQVTGTVELRGTTSDNAGGTGVKSLKYTIPSLIGSAWEVPAAADPAVGSVWKPVSSGTLAWKLQFNDTMPLKNYANATYGQLVSAGIWKVPIVFRTEDNAGNIHISSASDYFLLVDPDGDRPKVTITYPVLSGSETYITLGGAFRVFGTAEDNEFIKSVWMQIDTDGDGDYDAADEAYLRTKGYTVTNPALPDDTTWTWGIQVSGTNSWYIELNKAGQFDPSSGNIRVISYRVRAVDRDNESSGWTAPVTIHVDKSAPRIGSTKSLRLVQYANNSTGTGAVTAVRQYFQDMWVSGLWYLTGSIEDESGIAGVTVSGGLTGSLTTSSGWFAPATYASPYSGYDMKIPLGAGTENTRLDFEINVQDNSSPSQSTRVSISVNRDNTAPDISAALQSPNVDPTLSSLNIDNTNNTVKQSNKVFSFGSVVEEPGSGFGFAAFWFERKGNGSTSYDRLYNVMEDKAANSTLLSLLTLDQGLPILRLTGAVRSEENTIKHTSIIGNKNIRKGGIVKIGGSYRFITKVDHATGTVSIADMVDTSLTDADFAYAFVVNNLSVETLNETTGIIANDDGDGMVESVERSGGNYTWTASINSKNIPDGPIEIHYVVYDKAGNLMEKSVVSKVENNPPRIAKVWLGTDLNGNASIEPSETQSYSTLDGNNKPQRIAEVDASGATPSLPKFTAKAETTVTPEIVGGNGSLYYALVATSGGTNKTIALDTSSTATSTKIRDGDSPSPELAVATSAMKLSVDTAGKLIGLDDSAGGNFDFTIWDSTEETVHGTSSQFAVLTVKMHVDAKDEVVPKAVIKPFHWNSATDNSLYGNSKANGHIELEADLPATPFNAAAGIMDKDPKVSGKISIRGTAYDDHRLTELWAAIEGFTFTALPTQTINAVTGMVRLATYSAGVWTVTAGGDMAANGWAFTVTDGGLGQDGHRVTWQLDWDSSKVTGVAALDKKVHVISKDKGGNYAPATITGTSADPETLYNKPIYRMDVVPYITAIKTTDRTNGGLKDQNIRSTDGRYSIMQGTGAGFITVSGFNLNPNAARIVNQSTVAGATMTSGNAIAYSGVNAAKTSFSLSNNNNNSGYLEVFTGGIRALNNINANDAKGVYTGSDAVQMYNREADPYMRKNLLLNDDRYLRFFSMKGTAVKNGYYPDMIMEGNDPVFGYVNLTGGLATAVGIGPGTGAGSSYPSHAMPQRAKFDGSTAAEMYTEYLIKASIWDQMAMARDAGGRYIQASVYNRDTCSMSLIYDRYAELYTNGMGWGSGVTYSTYSGNKSDDTGNNAITLESVNQGLGLLLGRYQYPKLIAKGNSITGNAQIYMLYYDDNTAGRDLIFRNFRIGTSVALGNQLFSGGTSSTGGGYAQYSNLADGDTAGRLTAASDASKYFDLAVTSDNRIIVLYYDEGASRLKLRYSSAAVDGSSPNTPVTWVDSPIVFPDYVGTYVSMTLDSANGIHISAFDASDADLKYMYIPAYDSTTLNTVTVDAAFSVGSWTKIKVRETGGTIVPYISYFNNTESGTRESIKLAYCKSAITAATVPAGVDATGNTTGNWECLTVPAITPPQGGSLTFKQVCLDFDNTGRPVLGYLGTNLEFGKWLDE